MITRYYIDKISSKYGLVKLYNKADGTYNYCYLPDSNIWNNSEYEYPSALFTIYEDETIIRKYDEFDLDNKKYVFYGGTYEDFKDLTEDDFKKFIIKCISKVKKAIIKLKLASIKEDFK